MLGASRWFASQLLVSVVATACASALFANWQTPVAPLAQPVAETGKSIRRVADGAIETTVLRYNSQQQAALASLASFTPTTAPAVAIPAAARANAPAKIVTVLPPPRPVLTAEVPAPVLPLVPAAKPEQGWRVAGVEIPGSARVRGIVPSGDDLLRTGGAAWTASARVVRKVATLGGLFDL